MSGLLDEAIAAHGGAERFGAADAVHVRQRAGGAMFKLKGREGRPGTIDGVVSTHELRTELRDYPAPGLRGLVEPDGAVRIEDAQGRVRAHRAEPRPAFRYRRHLVRWDDLDQLYFIGATALPNYVLTPFWLRWPGVETEELPGRRLRARFPAGRVVPRAPGDRPLPGPTLVWIEVDAFALRPAAP
jgi:hypothetical protein